MLVKCDSITKSTCVIPQPNHIGPIDFGNRHVQPEIWLSEIENVQKVSKTKNNNNNNLTLIIVYNF